MLRTQHQPSWHLVFANANVRTGLKREVSSELGALRRGKHIGKVKIQGTLTEVKEITFSPVRQDPEMQGSAKKFVLDTKWTLGCHNLLQLG